jgi:tetratricopeptide (TPR) repeat protein
VYDEGRHRMLETVRAYAAGLLTAEVRDRHCTCYTELAERAAAGLESPDQARWAEDLEREYPNLRAALTWALDAGDFDRARRTCHGIWRFWRRGSRIREGREWLQRVLAMAGATGVQRARLLYPAAVLAATQDDHETAASLGEEGLRLAEAAGDVKTTAQARNVLGAAALAAGKYDEAAGHFRKCLDLCRDSGDAGGTTIALGNLAKLSLRLGEIDQAAAYIDQCLALERAAGNSGGILLGLECQGEILHAQGRLDEARRVLDESLALSRDLGDVFGEAMALHQLGSVARAGGDRAGALDGYLAAITLRHEVEDREGLAVTLECTAGVLADEQPQVAVRLLAAADVLRERYRLPVPPEQEPERDAVLRTSRLRLGDLVVRETGREGRATPLDLIIDQVTDLHDTRA